MRNIETLHQILILMKQLESDLKAEAEVRYDAGDNYRGNLRTDIANGLKLYREILTPSFSCYEDMIRK